MCSYTGGSPTPQSTVLLAYCIENNFGWGNYWGRVSKVCLSLPKLFITAQMLHVPAHVYGDTLITDIPINEQWEVLSLTVEGNVQLYAPTT